MIPSGDVIQALRKVPPFVYGEGGMSLCRDGFHMHYLYGRYALAATWYERLIGKDIQENTFMPHSDLWDGEADPEALAVIRKIVHRVCH